MANRYLSLYTPSYWAICVADFLNAYGSDTLSNWNNRRKAVINKDRKYTPCFICDALW